jgi:hypothetical protein
MRTAAQIEELWDLVHGGDPGGRVCIGPALTLSGPTGGGVTCYTELHSADLYGTRVRAYGLTDDEAIAALGELVALYARMRLDDIETALRGGA